MEESKDLIVGYKIFRSLVYVSLILEFFLYAVDPAVLDFWGGILMDLHARMKRWFIYADGNLIWSKVATLLMICVTCIGTRNKKQLEFDARRMVLYPLVSGLFIVVLSVWLFGRPGIGRSQRRLRLICGQIGTNCEQVALRTDD